MMKRIFTYLLGGMAMVSCTKDAEHHLQDKYAVVDIELTTSSVGTDVRFSADLSNYGSEKILDHGFIWGTRASDYRYFTDEDLGKWLNTTSDDGFKRFLIEKGTKVSLGSLDKPGSFTCDVNTVLGRKHLVMAYIKTNTFMVYSKVDIFDPPASVAWNKKDHPSYRNPDGRFFIANGKTYVFYDNTKIGELRASDYQFINKKSCPEYINTFYFVIGNNAYFSLNNHTMWIYHTDTDTWTSIAGKPNIPSYGFVSVSFTRGMKGYGSIYSYSPQGYCLYEFDPVNNTWTQKNEGLPSIYVWPNNLFYHKDQVYAYYNGELRYYNEDLATFQFKSHIGIDTDDEYVCSIVVLNGKVYMISQKGSVFEVYLYDPENDLTKKLCTLHNYYFNYSSAQAIALDNKIVFSTLGQTRLYELDPSKLK